MSYKISDKTIYDIFGKPLFQHKKSVTYGSLIDEMRKKTTLGIWADLSKAYLRSANFSYLNFKKARFNSSYLNFSKFHGTVLTQSRFLDAEIKEVDFFEADLDSAIISKAQFCKFKNSYMHRIRIHEAIGCDFRGSNFFEDAYIGKAINCLFDEKPKGVIINGDK